MWARSYITSAVAVAFFAFFGARGAAAHNVDAIEHIFGSELLHELGLTQSHADSDKTSIVRREGSGREWRRDLVEIGADGQMNKIEEDETVEGERQDAASRRAGGGVLAAGVEGKSTEEEMEPQNPALAADARENGTTRLVWPGLNRRSDEFINLASGMLYTEAAAWVVPTANDVQLGSLTQTDMNKLVCGLALDRTIPKLMRGHKPVPDFNVGIDFISYGALRSLPMPDSVDDCGEWDCTHWQFPWTCGAQISDRTAWMRTQIKGAWFGTRILVTWGDDRYSDHAVSDLVFRGIAQHRVVKIQSDQNAPAGAYYAVYLGGPGNNALEALQTKPGFAKLGADAYFDRDGSLLAIRRLGQTLTPVEPRDGSSRSQCVLVPCGERNEQTTCVQWCGRWDWWKARWTDCKRAVCGTPWDHAKMAFRGTLLAAVTAVDHLYGLHLTVANSMVTSMIDDLPTTHLLRRLLTPFTFRTGAINYRAGMALVTDRGLLHRSLPLTKQGIIQLFRVASASWPKSWRSIPEQFEDQGVDTIQLSMHQDGREYYEILRNFVHNYLSHGYDYSTNGCGKDAAVASWYERVDSIQPERNLPKPLTCERLEAVLATFMYYVSAHHRTVGTLGAESEDPCFMPWAWREGDACGVPRTALVQALVFASTSKEQPKITEDYTHLFEGAYKGFWTQMTRQMVELGKTVSARNSQRARPFRTFEPTNIETGISI